MKLTFLLYHYFPFGGQQRDFMKVSAECVARGHEVTAYVLKWEGDRPDGIRVVLVPVKAFTHVKLYQKYSNWLEGEFKQNSPGLLIGFNRVPGLDVHFAADPCFAEKAVTQRRGYYKYTARYRHFKAYEQAVFGSESSTQVLVLSPQQEKAFAHYYPGCEPRLHMIPPGIDENRKASSTSDKHYRCSRRKIRQQFSLGQDDYLLLQVGSGFKVKGVDRSLKALASLPVEIRKRCKYVLVGKDDPKRFTRLAKSLGVIDNFDVILGSDDIPGFLAAADLMLHPAYQESAGYTLLEATVAGVPVLTTASCGYSFHVKKADSGMVCDEPFDQTKLNQSLQQMLESLPDSSWRDNGIQYGETEDLYSQTTAMVDFIERL